MELHHKKALIDIKVKIYWKLRLKALKWKMQKLWICFH